MRGRQAPRRAIARATSRTSGRASGVAHGDLPAVLHVEAPIDHQLGELAYARILHGGGS